MGEGDPLVVDNPDADTIRRHTAADDPEKRAELADTVARARLHWPAPALEGLAVFDTPGINTLNAAVIATTYRIIPLADLVIFVTGPKSLSSTELEFLTRGVFRHGITRTVVVIFHDPRIQTLTESAQADLTRAVKNQLAAIGRDHVPVVNHFGGKKTASTPSATEASPKNVSEIISQLWGEAPKQGETGSGDSNNGVLPRLIRENVRMARREKALSILTQVVQQAMARIDTELAALAASEDDRRRLESDMRLRKADLLHRHAVLTREFSEALAALQTRSETDLTGDVTALATTYDTDLADAADLPALRSRLAAIQERLPRDMEQLMWRRFEAVRNALTDLVQTYGGKSQVMLAPFFNDLTRSAEIDGGLLSRIPPFAVLALDLLLFARFGPFGPVADILIRLLVHYIPYVNRALPASVAAAVLRQKLRRTLADQFRTADTELRTHLDEMFREIRQTILDEWEDHFQQQVKLLEIPPDASSEAASRRRMTLKAAASELGALITEADPGP